MRFQESRPEPARFWTRWTPTEWPGPDVPFLDLARGTLAGPSWREESRPLPIEATYDDTVYLPAVRPQASAWRDEIVSELADGGAPILLQLLPRDSKPAPTVNAVYDLTDALLTGTFDQLATLPEGAATAWPLLPGITDSQDLIDESLEILAKAGVTVVQPTIPDLSPDDRRRLSESRDESVYHALFHGGRPNRQAFAGEVIRKGMSPLIERPLPNDESRRTRNRRLAAHLARVAELWLLAGRPEGRAQALFRAARWADEEPSDINAIALEGNLGVIDWLEAETQGEIEIHARGESSELENELLSAIAADS